jgi:penicillin-binding protein 1A
MYQPPTNPTEPQKKTSSLDTAPHEEEQRSAIPETQVAPITKIKKRVGSATGSIRRVWSNRNRTTQIAIVALVSGGTLFAAGWWAWRSIDRSLPDPQDVFTYARPGTITIKAEDGTILQQVGPATYEKLKLKDTPKQLIEAFLAAEDHRFYKHHGIDFKSIARAFGANIWARDVVEGGSTITQQLARLVFLTQDQTMGRKVKEALLAQKIDTHLSKDDILENYLNLVYLGSGAYGVSDAAWVYFGKDLNKLSLAEMATIAGMPAAPSDYSPIENPDLARKRRDLILQRMADSGFITESAATAAISQPIKLDPSLPKRLAVKFPYFTTYVQQELKKYVSAEQIEGGGLTVETSLNPDWQKVGEEAVKDAVANYGYGEGFEEAALVAIDPKTGEIKTMVGGSDFEKSQFNRASQAMRQPGSTFKGLLYTTAIAAGFSPYDGYEDKPLKVDGYQPLNAGRKYSGWMNLQDALTRSVNVIAVKVLMDVGFEPTIKLAKNMGIKSELKPVYSLALGSFEVTLLELTNAYATLADNGEYRESHGIRRILDRDGKVLYDAKKEKPKQVVDQDSVAIITSMLENVVNSGTGTPARLDDRAVAGKTGTSDESRDLWFIGYIPQLVTGVWLGNDDNAPTYGNSGTAAQTWYNFMLEATEKLPVKEFPELPELDGREGTIKAKPVESANISYPALTEAETNSETTASSESQEESQGDHDQNDYGNSDQSDYGNSDQNDYGNSDQSDYGNSDQSDYGNSDQSDYGNGGYAEDQYDDSGSNSSSREYSSYSEEPYDAPLEESYSDYGSSDTDYAEPSDGGYESEYPAAPAEDLKILPYESEAPAPEAPASEYVDIKPDLPPKQ